MAAVFPENMDKLNPQDVGGSFAKLESYVRYMGERIDFAMRNTTKQVSAAGVSSTELYILLQAQTQTLAALQSSVNAMQGSINGMASQMTTMQGQISTIQGQIATIQTNVSALDGRVTALENNTGG